MSAGISNVVVEIDQNISEELIDDLVSLPESLEEVDEQNAARHTKNSKAGTKRSRVYDYFVQNPVSKKWKCTIKPCSVQLANPKSGGTGSMVNHLKNVHKKKYAEFLEKNQSKDGKLTKFMTPAAHPESHVTKLYDNEIFKQKLVKFIISTNQPFSLGENESFRDLLSYIARDDTEISMPNSKPIRKLVAENYMKLFEDLKATLQTNLSKVSFTVDCWTSRNGYAFQGITAHYINDEWKLKTVVLDLSILEGNHSGANLADNFAAVLTRFGLWNKLLALTSDNASKMNKFAERLELKAAENGGCFEANNFRVRCMAHIINLSCQEIIKKLGSVDIVNNVERYDEDDTDEEESESHVSMDSSHVVDKIRHCCVGIRSSPQRREQLVKQCHAAGMPPKNVILDVRTRWNSTLEMLERVVELKKPFQLTLQSFKKLEKYVPTTNEWAMLEKMISLLKPFQEATKLLSEEGMPKLSQTLAIYNALFEHLEKYMESPSTNYKNRRESTRTFVDEILKNAADAGWGKLTEYYPTSDGIVFAVATVLDPRFKCNWFNKAGWKRQWITQTRSSVRRIWQSHYKTSMSSAENRISSPSNSGLKSSILEKFQYESDENPTDELSRYLSEQTESVEAIEQLGKENGEKDGVLCWWKNNHNSYPQLAKMARDFLAVSGTGVPVERLFSSAVDLLSHRRQSMSAETIRQCLCLKNWYKDYKESNVLEAICSKALGESV